MNRITEITKRDILDLFRNGLEIDEFLETKTVVYCYWRRLTEIDFLKRLYDLEKLPSNDPRYKNAESDIWQHTENNEDYPFCWVFEDERFDLMYGSDEKYLKFICEIFHPAVRNDKGYWMKFLEKLIVSYKMMDQSVAECCRKYDVRAASVRNRASSTGCSIEEALDHFIKKKIVTKKNEFIFRNKSYETLEECCEVYGVNANSVSSRKYRLGCSTDESLEHFIANKEIIEERIQKFTFKGMEYPSLRACCKKYGIEDACVRQRARDKNCSIEESFEHFMTRKRKKMLDNPEFDYHGTLYPSLKECCEQLKISKNSVVSKSRRSGCSLQEAVEYYVKKQHNK